MANIVDDYVKFRERKRWAFLGLPLTFTVYTIKVDDNDEDGVDRPDMLTIDKGFLSKEENDCYLYKITDVRLRSSVLERIFKLGTVLCYASSDKTDDIIELKHIRNAKEIKDYLLAASEKARLKRRTINTMNLSEDGIL